MNCVCLFLTSSTLNAIGDPYGRLVFLSIEDMNMAQNLERMKEEIQWIWLLPQTNKLNQQTTDNM